MTWTVETLNAAVDAEVNALPADMRARLARISAMIGEFGLERMREPHVKRLRGPLWEMRMRGRDGISAATAAGTTLLISFTQDEAGASSRYGRAARAIEPKGGVTGWTQRSVESMGSAVGAVVLRANRII